MLLITSSAKGHRIKIRKKIKNVRPGQDLNLRSPKEETVFETVALPLDYLGILLKM
jgi:hypothetical protein